MALIKCPECGKEISDKALKCPQCGYPLKGDDIADNITSGVNTQKGSDSKNILIKIKESIHRVFRIILSDSKKRLVGIIIIAIALIGIIFSVIGNVIGNRLSVEDISIDKWRLTSSGTYYDDYEGTVTSNETNTFVAVIGNYEDSSENPEFVLMEDGKGILETLESTDEDPSLKYKPIGYLEGMNVKETDFIHINYEDIDYLDLTDTTSCTIEIEVEMKNKISGLLWLEMSNDLTNDIDRNIKVEIVNGKGECARYISDMPVKSRGVEVEITPKYFCESTAIKESDYEIETPFVVEKNEGEYSTSYVGEEELVFPNYENGIVIYTEELLEGGNKEDRGKTNANGSFIKDGGCNLTTYTSVDSEETVSEPTYDIQIVGYVGWQNYNN